MSSRSISCWRHSAQTRRWGTDSSATRIADRKPSHFQQAECVDPVLVPLDHAALVHRGILDRHEPRELVACDHETADVLRQMTWKTAQGTDKFGEMAGDQRMRIETGFGKASRHALLAIPPLMRLGNAFDELCIEAECLAHVAQRT